MTQINDSKESAVVEKEPSSTSTKSSKRKVLLLAFLLLSIGAGGAYALYYHNVLSQREETDNAYIGGNLVTLTPQVNGIVTDISADETQLVSAGQAVIKLDPADAMLAFKQAEAELGETVRLVKQQFANTDQYKAIIAQRRIDLARAQTDYARRAPLLKEKAVSVEEVEHGKQAIANAQAALTIAAKQLTAAESGIEGVKITEHPSVLKARAKFEQAYLAVKRNTIQAPVTGYVAKRSVQIGQRIAAGTALMSIIPLDALWIDANFKEPELRNIRIGQPANITTDLYGDDVIFHGRVIGLAAGTGAAFSLLPAQNATGNWIKVVQRIPVRIQLEPAELKEHPLRVGLSATATVDTHNRQGAVLATLPQKASQYSTHVFEEPLNDASALAEATISKHAGRAGFKPTLPLNTSVQ
ncbi:MAG: HlyD family efflux transporter periplasmic adaptor subunit [Pseudomonadota bacterium]